MERPVSSRGGARRPAARAWWAAVLAAALLHGPGYASEPRPAGIEPLGWTAVEIDDPFWSPRLETNRSVSLRILLDEAARRGRLPSPKTVETAGYMLARVSDGALREELDGIVARMAAGLLPEGKPWKWKDLLNGEMYYAGHVFEAAAVYHAATGNRVLLDAALELAEDIDRVFGPGKRMDVSQHEEIKLGLLRLYQHTGDERWLAAARFFLDRRGIPSGGRALFGEYAQDHLPVVEQDRAVGHCVRATYLYTPLAWLADLTGEPSYRDASLRLWEDVYSRRAFLTGHFGSHRDHEDFGEDYELPNLSAWNETCSAVGAVFWNHRLFLLTGEAAYLDMLERTLYNAVLAGVSLDGTRWFYQNPLMSYGGFERQPRFGPNCCPPNVARLLASLGGYVYSTDRSGIYVHLHIGSRARVDRDFGVVRLEQKSGFPWEGTVSLRIEPERPSRFSLRVRIPGWTRDCPFPGGLYRYLDPGPAVPVFKLNRRRIDPPVERGFAVFDREWEPGDLLEMEVPMPVRRVLSHPGVKDNRGKTALERGPLVYCVEGADHGGTVSGLLVREETGLTARHDPNLLGGVTVLSGEAERLRREAGTIQIRPVRLRALPYFAWANRGAGDMSVWIPRTAERVPLPPLPTPASTAAAASSCGDGSPEAAYPGGKLPDIARRFFPHAQTGSAGIEVLCDQIEPDGSADGSGRYFRLRPQSGESAWVQYDFPAPFRVTAVEVYWKDDGEFCRLPVSWRLLYQKGSDWAPVPRPSGYPVRPDDWCRSEFPPVVTKGLRLEILLRGLEFRRGDLGPPDANYLQEDTTWFEGGIIEWKVEGKTATAREAGAGLPRGR